MLYHVTVKSISGENFSKKSPTNGDNWVAHTFSGRFIAAVIDGASSPTMPYLLNDVASDHLVALWTRQALLQQAKAQTNPTAESLIQGVIEPYAETCTVLAEDVALEAYNPALDNPACAFALVVLEDDGTFTWAQGADAVLCGVRQNGDIVILAGDQVAPLFRAHDLERVESQRLLKEGMSPHDVLALERAAVRKNRARIYNTPEGCAVLNGDAAMLNLMQTGCANIKQENFKRLILMTDGVFSKLGADNLTNIYMAAQTLNETGAEGMTEVLESIAHPYSTDATMLVIDIL